MLHRAGGKKRRAKGEQQQQQQQQGNGEQQQDQQQGDEQEQPQPGSGDTSEPDEDSSDDDEGSNEADEDSEDDSERAVHDRWAQKPAPAGAVGSHAQSQPPGVAWLTEKLGITAQCGEVLCVQKKVVAELCHPCQQQVQHDLPWRGGVCAAAGVVQCYHPCQ